MRLCLVEDHAVCQLEPLTLTRPVHELLLGGITLESKIARALGIGPGPQRRSCLIRSHLVDDSTAACSAHGGQRPGLAGAVAGDRRQQPMGSTGWLRTARFIWVVGWALRRPARTGVGRAGRCGRARAAGGGLMVRADDVEARRP